MTPTEIHAECIAIAASLHPEAYASASIASDARPHGAVRACCYPRGVGRSERHDVLAKTFEEAFAALRKKMESVRDAHAVKTTRAIALAIIQQTMDFGECTDAALRAEFSAGEVEAYGAAAIEEANKLSENRPFRIVATRGANAA